MTLEWTLNARAQVPTLEGVVRHESSIALLLVLRALTARA